jgi:hypothetical protein
MPLRTKVVLTECSEELRTFEFQPVEVCFTEGTLFQVQPLGASSGQHHSTLNSSTSRPSRSSEGSGFGVLSNLSIIINCRAASSPNI